MQGSSDRQLLLLSSTLPRPRRTDRNFDWPHILTSPPALSYIHLFLSQVLYPLNLLYSQLRLIVCFPGNPTQQGTEVRGKVASCIIREWVPQQVEVTKEDRVMEEVMAPIR